MTITPETTAQATIVPLLGQINSANAGALEAQLLTLVDGGVRQLVLDFAALDYISSAGLRLVLVLAKRSKTQPGNDRQATAAILLAVAMMYLRVLVLVAIFRTRDALKVAPVLLVLALLSAGYGLWVNRDAPHEAPAAMGAGPALLGFGSLAAGVFSGALSPFVSAAASSALGHPYDVKLEL